MKINKAIFYVTLILATFTSSMEVWAQLPATAKTQWKSASEFIFSWSDMEATGGTMNAPVEVSPVLRFSGFFHLQEQFHVNFGKHAGMFTGLGVRNVGMINKLNDSIKVKQRVYSFGIPLAFKFGNMVDGFYFSLGGEAEFFIHYKQKVFHDDEKYKSAEWFSDKVNIFNPSVFLDLNMKRGSYIRFKYYITDFLAEDEQRIRKINGSDFPFYPHSGKIFYVAIGSTIKHFGKKRMRPVPGKPATAGL